MLELRPTCEHCNKDLPPNSVEAMICSFECTFCQACVDTVLDNVCPNCGGGFSSRPIRPCHNLKGDNCTGMYPATTKVMYKPVNLNEHRAFSASIKTIKPNNR